PPHPQAQGFLPSAPVRGVLRSVLAGAGGSRPAGAGGPGAQHRERRALVLDPGGKTRAPLRRVLRLALADVLREPGHPRRHSCHRVQAAGGMAVRRREPPGRERRPPAAGGKTCACACAAAAAAPAGGGGADRAAQRRRAVALGWRAVALGWRAVALGLFEDGGVGRGAGARPRQEGPVFDARQPLHLIRLRGPVLLDLRRRPPLRAGRQPRVHQPDPGRAAHLL
ncbi:MAG: hypothetical protein BJ554DRAFT_1120, partial [Olpidium bornovanus]